MSKRHAVGSSRSRKKIKGSSHASVDLDLPDKHPDEVEVIRVWDVTTSKVTGRVSATRKAHLHVSKGVSRPTREGQVPDAEDADISVNHESSEPPPPTKPVAKRRRKRAIKENDSVRFIQISPS